MNSHFTCIANRDINVQSLPVMMRNQLKSSYTYVCVYTDKTSLIDVTRQQVVITS